ncbi:MAG: triose-phosphate isomerase [Gammaproteobacteria bacterium]|nr:triose-phosphate isomerase [Gammaproteobacteria bacterium]NNM13849.1 triose-phosphate isomerase [Gammaproteobacteria bacterium]
MRKPLVAGNWKMNGSFELTNALIGSIIDQINSEDNDESGNDDAIAEPNVDILVCPPYVYLETAARALENTPLKLGAQNVSSESPGAFTGEICAFMLKDLTCSYVIVGHSERRNLYAETDTIVGRKFKAAAEAGLNPILCIGESLDERAAGNAISVIKRQLDAVIDIAGINAFAKAVIAYEPVWAIGTGKTASPRQAQDIHQEIRQMLAERSGKIADDIRILYGGSVKPGNAEEIFAMPDIDGGLIGGAALNAADFVKIIESAA